MTIQISQGVTNVLITSKGEEDPTLMVPATPQTGSYSSLENVYLNR